MKGIVEILIDNSNSMGYFETEKGKYLLPDGSTRMELAKRILLEEIIPQFLGAFKITIRKFHSNTTQNKTQSLVISTIYDGSPDQAEIISAINNIEIPKNTGGTPITGAVMTSIDALAKFPNDDTKIILVTDGEENEGGDYRKAIKDGLDRYNIHCNVFIVGIALNAFNEEQTKEFAQSTGGGYVNLKAQMYDRITLQRALMPIKLKAISSSIGNNGIFSAKGNSVAAENIDSLLDRQSTNSEEIEAIISRIDNQEETLLLISKQLENLANAVLNLRLNNDVDEEISIQENSELNEKIRMESEAFLFDKLKMKLGERVTWMNQYSESGLSYDFEVIDTIDNTIEYYIECKASIKPEKTFLMTKNEWLFFLMNRNKYQIFFVSDVFRNPDITKIENLMDWIWEGKIVPYSQKNIKLKAERIIFTII